MDELRKAIRDYVALWRHLVDVNVKHSAVPAALVYNVITNFQIPVGGRLRGRIEHVGQQEALGRNWRVHRSQLLLLLLLHC